MSKHSYISGGGRSDNANIGGRADTGNEDERPLAEVRKTVNDVLRIVLLHRWSFFVPFCLVCSAAFVFTLQWPRLYTASVSFQRHDDPIVHNLPTTEGTGSFTYFRTTMHDDIVSADYMADVVDNLGLIQGLERNPDGSLTDKARERCKGRGRALAGSISVATHSPSEHIDLITVSYTGPDGDLAKPLVDEIRRTYVRRTMARVREFLETQRTYFEEEAEQAHLQLNEARRALTELRMENPHINPDDPGELTLKLGQLEIERRDLLLRRRMADANVTAYRQMLAVVEPVLDEPAVVNPASVTNTTPVATESLEAALDPRVLALYQQIKAVDTEVAQLKRARGMTNQHPQIVELLTQKHQLEQQVAEYSTASSRPRVALSAPAAPWEAGERTPLNRSVVANAPLTSESPWNGTGAGLSETPPSLSAAVALAGPTTTYVNPTYNPERTRLQVQLDALLAQLQDLDISLEQNADTVALLERAKRDLFKKQEGFQTAMAEVDAARSRYAQHRETLTRLEPGLRAVEQGRLLQFSEDRTVSGSAAPVSPKTSTVMLVALLAGVAVGAVFVVLAEVFDHAFRSSSRVARSLGLPILETIDEIVTAKDRRKNVIRQMVVVPVTVGCCLGALLITGMLAYTSVARPWAYERMVQLPTSAWHFVAGPPAEQASAEKSAQ